MKTVILSDKWRIQVVKKEGARVHKILKITDFRLSFTLKKVKFAEKREGLSHRFDICDISFVISTPNQWLSNLTKSCYNHMSHLSYTSRAPNMSHN